MSEARDVILARVREALQSPTDAHVRENFGEGLPASYAARLDLYAHCLPDPGPDRAAWTQRFAAMSDNLKTRFIVTSKDGAIESLRTIAAEEGWKSIAAHAHPLVDPVVAALDLPRGALADVDAGLTACDALVAQTGSVLLTARSAGGRALSVLPPHHVVIATADQLVPDLPTAYDVLRKRYAERSGGWPSFTTLITGPSRTGDIERILVLGAHGPKRLTVLLLES